MKNRLKQKFKNNILVKPLYRKLKNGNKINPKILVIDSTLKLDGDGISVKRNIVNDNGGILSRKKYISKENRIFLCGSRENNNKKRLFDTVNGKQFRNGLRKGHSMLSAIENRNPNNCEVDGKEEKTNVEADNEIVIVQKTANTWLRVYPLPKLPEETVRSVIFRCILCQLGLFTVLMLWSIVWVFVIHYFEGPNEIKVSMDFEKEQNLLVIDLATELRQHHEDEGRRGERHIISSGVSRARPHTGRQLLHPTRHSCTRAY